MWKLLTFTSLPTFSADRLYWLWYWEKLLNISAVFLITTAKQISKR